ncbi:hypothetical protein ACWGE0_11750 [Lentzea sp. NPDC054927]
MTELRVVRAALVAVLSSAVSVAAHGAAGGGMPDLGSTLLLTLMIAGAATALADRRRSAKRTVAILAAAQLSQHVMLTWLSGLAHHHDLSLHPAMIAAHVAALVVSGFLLARAEDVVFAVAGAFAAFMPRLLVSLPMPADVPVAVPVWSDVDPVRTVLLRRQLGRRGPPRGF